MNCRRARKYMVAWQDGELSPSQAAQVEEHLQGCSACAAREQKLAAVTPRPEFQVPTRVHIQLAAAVEEALRQEALRPAPPDPPEPGWMPWLATHAKVPLAMSLAYVGLLALSTGWGVQNWLHAQQLAQRLEAAAPIEAQASVTPVDRGRSAEPWRSPVYTPPDHWF